MVNKVNDLQFDCSTWDEDGSNFVGLTGIMFDSVIQDEKHNILAIGAEITPYLDKELAKACGCNVDEIEKDIYE